MSNSDYNLTIFNRDFQPTPFSKLLVALISKCVSFIATARFRCHTTDDFFQNFFLYIIDITVGCLKILKGFGLRVREFNKRICQFKFWAAALFFIGLKYWLL